jgi:hypothetical protein
MSSNHETSETFTERVDVTTQPEGAFIGTLEVGVISQPICEDNHLEELNALRAEVLTLRSRVRELEAEVARLT